MAENYQINIDVKTDGVEDIQGKFDSLRGEIEKTEKAIDKLQKTEGKSHIERKHNAKKADELRKKLGKLNVEYDSLTKTNTDYNATLTQTGSELGSVQQQINNTTRRLEALALAGDTTSKEYEDLTAHVKKLNDVQKSTNKTLGKTEKHSHNTKDALHGVVGALEIGVVAMSAFGMEGEAVEEKILKVQQAMALSHGITQVQKGVTAFKDMGKSAVMALKGIKKGVAATGIGVFLVALGAVVAYWDDIIELFGEGKKELEGFNEATKKVDNSMVDLNAEIASMENSFELAKQGTISHEQALKQYNEEFGDTIGYAETLEEAEKKFVERTDIYVKAVKMRALADAFYKKNAEKLVEAQQEMQTTQMGWVETGGQALAHFVGATDMSAAEAEKVRKKHAAKMRKLEAEEYEALGDSYALQALQLEAQLDKLVGSENKKHKTSKRNRKTHAKEMLDLENEIWDIENANLEKLYGKTLEVEKFRLEESYIRKQEAFEKMFEDEKITKETRDKVLLALEEKYHEDRNLLREKYKLKEFEFEKDKEVVELVGMEKKVNAQAEMYNAMFLITAEFYEKEKVLREKNKQFAIESAASTFGTIANLANAFADESEKSQERAFKITKAANIAQALVTTYMSATQAYASQFLPLPDPSSPVRGGVAAGLAVASGLANVAMIAKQKFKGESESGGGSTSTSTGAGGLGVQPSFNVVGDSGANQLAELTMTPTQAYVVSGDITTAQSLDRNKIDNATI